ncbi:AGC family protein kinase [Trichomonas vaginalis G3]|uniref:AGC family protein kinase n=1 Tax=Trichomonas vaginalis (strain ATCC PRA-98 / G3) TaxID=412133 RepID=A2GBV0_TRIV3|nr:protein serine/threonine kinase protein [Trichomonas vaginalis G3]EAX85364.1 AGC family protein kinase [Trichomonas vaginalis G3]KAI5534963.1 protein serine/threonine kinase protein [Trichomonas vaginalis G3]|eukprot:XP_001298294.1 AGC family protein kinase [Trichomonas vaginalis G3]
MRVLYEGTIKERGSKLGFWHNRKCYIADNKLYIHRGLLTPNNYHAIPLSASTRIDFVPETKDNEIIIQYNNNQFIVLSASTKNEVDKLYNALCNATLSSTNLNMSCFEIISSLGRGHFGKVNLCRRINSQLFYAIKSIHKSQLMEQNKINTVIVERDVLLVTRCPFIVHFCFSFQTTSKFYLGLEYVPGGDLHQRILSAGTIPLHDLRIYLAEIVLGLEDLHKRSIVYRDLKPENILITSEGHLKLTDFGLAKFSQNPLRSLCGTMEYVAPEMVRNEPYGSSVDIWSLGIITYEMAIGRTPFKRANQFKTFKAILEEEPSINSNIDSKLLDLIQKLLVKDPKKRLTIDEINSHPFFESINFNKVLKLEEQPNYIPNIKSIEQLRSQSEDSPADSFGEPVYMDSLYDGFTFVNI